MHCCTVVYFVQEPIYNILSSDLAISNMDFKEGNEYDLGPVTLSEEEVIDFAKHYDPLEFHIDRQAAEKSVFGRIVASGPHLFNWYYRNRWVPIVKDSVLAGLEINHWKLHAPVLPGKPYTAKLSILSIHKNPAKKRQVIVWKVVMKNESEVTVQELEMTVLHLIKG